MGLFTIIAAIIAVATSAASYMQAKKAEKMAAKQAEEMAAVQLSGHNSNRSLYTVYGEALVGSTTVYKRISGRRVPLSLSNFLIKTRATGADLTSTESKTAKRYFYRVVTLCNGPVEDITNILVDGEGFRSPRFGYDHNFHFGSAISKGPTAGQHYSRLANYSEFFQWDNTKTGKGVAYAVERLYLDKNHPAFQGEPSTQYLVKGRLLYDPRLDSTVTGGSGSHRQATPSTWVWTDNPAICLLDYITNTEYGRGLAYSTIDLAAIMTAANACDVLVDVPARLINEENVAITLADILEGEYEVNVPVGTVIPIYRPNQAANNKQKRYRINTAIDGAKEVLDNIQQILNVFKANLVYVNGKYTVTMADVASSVLSLGDDDIIGGLNISDGDRAQRMNRATIKFTNANKNYKTDQVSWPEIGSTAYNAYLTEDQDEKIHRTFTIDGCTDLYQAEDTAEFIVRDGRVGLTVGGTFGSRALALIPGDVVALTYDSASYAGKYFRVQTVALNLQTMNVALSLREYDSSVYTWNASRGNEPLGLNWDTEPVNLSPTSPTFGTIVTSVITQADGSAISMLEVPFSGVPDQASKVEISWSVQNANNYNTITITDLANETSAKFPVGLSGVTYDVRLRYVLVSVSGTSMPSAYVYTTIAVPGLASPIGTKVGGIDEGATATVIYRQTTAPSGTAHNTGDQWFDTDNGNKHYVWDGSNWASVQDAGITTAIADAAASAAAADGKIDSFYQDAAPSVASEGDLWFDTDDGNKIYTRRSGVWVATQDSAIATALQDAADADAKADGKVTTFYQNAAPTAEGIGDLWVDTDDGNKLYRWSGSAWVSVQDTAITTAIQNAAASQEAADGKIDSFYQDAAPSVASEGDLWFDTNDGNKIYTRRSGAWVVTQDSAIGTALQDAADADAKADGKVTTFYQNDAPTAEGIGDLWVDTNDGNKLYRWSGSAWVSVQDTAIATAQQEAEVKYASFFRVTITSGTSVAAPSDSVFEAQFDRAPIEHDQLVVTNTATTPDTQAAYVRGSSAWGTAVDNFLSGDLIVDGSIGADHITVTSLSAIDANLGTITTGNLHGGNVAGITINATKLYEGAGTYEGSTTGFYLGSDGKFSLSDKLSFDASATDPVLSITGNLTANSVTVGTGADSVTMAGGAPVSSGVAKRLFTGVDGGENTFVVSSDGHVEARNFSLYDSGDNLIYTTVGGFQPLALTQIASSTEGVKVTTYSEALDNDSDEVEIVVSQTSNVTVKVIKTVSSWTGVGESTSSEAAAISIAKAQLVDSFDMMIRYHTSSGFTVTQGTLASAATSGAANYTRFTQATDYVKDGMLWFYDPEGNGQWRARANVRTNHLDVSASGQVVLSATISSLAAGTYYFKTFMRTTDGSGYNSASIKVGSTNSRTFEITDNTSDGGFVVDGGAAQTVGAADITSVNITTAANGGLTGGSNQTSGAANFTLAVNQNQSLNNVTLGGYLRGPATFTIDPAAHNNDTGTVVIAGNLQVDGTQTTVNSTVVEIADLNFKVAKDAANAAAANTGGLTVGGANAELKYIAVGDKWTMNKPLELTGAMTVSDSILVSYSGNDGAGRDAGLKIQNDGTDWGAYIRKASAAQYGLRIDSAGSLALAIYSSEGGSTLTFSVNGSTGALSSGIISATGGTSTQWNTAYTYSQVGHLPLAGGTLSGGLSGTTGSFSGNVSGNRFILPSTVGGGTEYIYTNNSNTGTGSLIIQAGEGSAAYGGGLRLYSHSHASKAGWVTAGISSGSGGKFSVNNQGTGGGTDVFTVDASGNTVTNGTSNVTTELRVNQPSTSFNFSNVDQYMARFNTSVDKNGSINLVNHEGNWSEGVTGIDYNFGLAFGWVTNQRAGIAYDVRGIEKFDIYSTYGEMRFRTTTGGNTGPTGSETSMPPRLVISPQGIVKGVLGLDAPTFRDSDNTAYYVDPTGLSNLTNVGAQTIGVTGSNGTDGKGISLYGGISSGQPTYGLMFMQTSSFGTHGNVTADWATYFTMNNTANRGWIFRNTTNGNVASINNAGAATFDSGVTTPYVHLLASTQVHMDLQSTGDNRSKIGSKANDMYIGQSSGVGQIIFKNNISSTGHPADSGDTKMVISDSGVSVTGTATFSGAVTAPSLQLGADAQPTLSGDGSQLKIQTTGGYVQIGPANSSWMHFSTDRPVFYFNTQITVDTGLINSYDEDIQLRRAASTTNKFTVASGYNFSTTELRAPKFVSSNTNAYYAELDSLSKLERISVGPTTVAPANNAGGRLRVASYTTGETAMSANTHAMLLGPSASRFGTAKRYYAGIAWNGLMNYNNNTTYDAAPHIWIGGKYRDTPGSERSDFVIGVKSGTGTSGSGSDIPQDRFTVDYTGLCTATGPLSGSQIRIGSTTVIDGSTNITSTGNIKITTNGNLLEIADAPIQWYSAQTSDYKIASMRAASYNLKGAGNSSILIANNNGISVTGSVSSTTTGSFTGNVTANGVTIGASDIRSSSNILTLGGTSERFRIDANGHFRFMSQGAGTQNNSSINNHTNNYMYFMGGSAGAMYQADNSGVVRLRLNSTTLALETAGTPRINIAADGLTTLSGVTTVSSGYLNVNNGGGGQISLGDYSNSNPIGISEGLWNTVGSDADYLSVYARSSFNIRGYAGGTTHWLAMTGSNFNLVASQNLQIGGTTVIDTNKVAQNLTGVNILADAANNANDAALYIRKTNNNDWAIKVDGTGSGTEYGIQVNLNGANSYSYRGLNAGSQYFRVGTDMLLHTAEIRGNTFSVNGTTIFDSNRNMSCKNQDVVGTIDVNGYSYAGGQNRDQMMYSGRDGTNTSSEYFTMGWKPTARSGEQMQPTNGPYNGGYAFYIEAGSSEAGGICLDQDSITVYGSSDAGQTFRVVDKDSDVVTFQMNQSTWDGVFRGNVIAYGSMSSISDKRIKENIEPIDSVLDRVNKLGVYSYNKITDPVKKTEIGVIAQEMQEQFPDLVGEVAVDKPDQVNGLETILTVDYEHLTAVLLKAVQELTTKVETLEAQLTRKDAN